MRNSSRSSTIRVLTALLIVVSADVSSAHRRDAYLQAARLGIEPDRVQIEVDLTPGIAVAGQVLAEVDGDANRSISSDETRAYAERVLSAIALDVDGVPVPLTLVDSFVPATDAVLEGEGTIRIRAVARIPLLADGSHHLRFRNAFRPDLGVYLANTLMPVGDRVTIRAQERDVDQRELLVDYNLRGDPATRLRQGLTVGFTGAIVLVANVWWRRRPREDV